MQNIIPSVDLLGVSLSALEQRVSTARVRALFPPVVFACAAACTCCCAALRSPLHGRVIFCSSQDYPRPCYPQSSNLYSQNMRGIVACFLCKLQNSGCPRAEFRHLHAPGWQRLLELKCRANQVVLTIHAGLWGCQLLVLHLRAKDQF